MKRDTIKNKLVQFLKDKGYINRSKTIDDDTPLDESGLGLDSLRLLKLLTKVEEIFEIRIEDEYWTGKKINNFGKIVDYVYKVMQ